MRQRVVIAMALACRPKLIIADEPTTALDVTIQAQILRLMSALQKEVGSSILMITHDLGVIAETVQKVAVMYAGKIVEQADTQKIFANPKHPYTKGLLDSIPDMDRPVPGDKKLKAIPGTVPSLMNLPVGCSFQERCGYVMDRCRREEPALLESGADHFVRCWLYE
jgi:peptide/nickel transport system ATP-binding protein